MTAEPLTPKERERFVMWATEVGLPRFSRHDIRRFEATVRAAEERAEAYRRARYAERERAERAEGRIVRLRAALAEIVADHLSDCPCDSIAWASIKADNKTIADDAARGEG